MKTGWQKKTLAEVCQIKPPKAEARRRVSETDLVSFVPMEDLGIDQKFIVPTQSKSLAEVAGSYTYFAEGDVLLAKITPCFENGKLGIAEGLSNGIGFGSSEYIVFRPDSSLSKEWLYYYLSRDAFRLEGAARMSGAVGHKRVAKEFIGSYPIPIPPLPEQQQIVGILDEAFEAIATAKANVEKNVQNARALFEGHLEAIFTQRGKRWTERRLGELMTFRNGVNFTKSSRGDAVKIVGVKDFQNKYWASLDNLDTVTTAGSLRDVDMLKENDLLFVRSNGNVELIGRCLLVGPVTEKIAHSGFTIRARLNVGSVIPKYLCHFLKSNKARRAMIDKGIGTNIKSLNQETLSALIIPLPSSAEQIRIVSRLEVFDAESQRLESIYRQKLAVLEELKKSLLHQAFSGQL